MRYCGRAAPASPAIWTWSAVPKRCAPARGACGRTAGWSRHAHRRWPPTHGRCRRCCRSTAGSASTGPRVRRSPSRSIWWPQGWSGSGSAPASRSPTSRRPCRRQGRDRPRQHRPRHVRPRRDPGDRDRRRYPQECGDCLPVLAEQGREARRPSRRGRSAAYSACGPARRAGPTPIRTAFPRHCSSDVVVEASSSRAKPGPQEQVPRTGFRQPRRWALTAGRNRRVGGAQ
jgi:hypothetical protein